MDRAGLIISVFTIFILLYQQFILKHPTKLSLHFALDSQTFSLQFPQILLAVTSQHHNQHSTHMFILTIHLWNYLNSTDHCRHTVQFHAFEIQNCYD
jgi:hypothetical protein